MFQPLPSSEEISLNSEEGLERASEFFYERSKKSREVIDGSEEENQPDEYYQEELAKGENKAIKILEERGLEYLGHGCSCVVFSLSESDNVVKFPRFGDEDYRDDGKIQIAHSVRLYFNLRDEGKLEKYSLAPIVTFGEKYLVQPECTPLDEVDEAILDGTVEETYKKVKREMRPLSDYINIFDITKGNIGVTENGKVVVFDYGLASSF